MTILLKKNFKKSLIVVFIHCFFILTYFPLTAKTPTPKSPDSKSKTTPKPPSIEVTVQNFIQEKELYAERDFHYVVQLNWQGEADAVEVRRPKTPPLDGLERYEVAQSNIVNPEKKEAVVKYIFTLRPLRTGKVAIGKLDINYVIKATGEEKHITIPGLELEIIPPPAKKSPLRPVASILKIILLIVLIILLGGAGWLILSGQLHIPIFRRRSFFDVDDSEPLPCERLKAEAATLRMHIINGDDKKFFDKLYLILRNLISQRTEQNLDNATDAEIVALVKQSINDEYFSRKTGEILEKCQQSRFGGIEFTSQEMEQVFKDFQDLLLTEERRYKKELKYKSGGT
ncbi:MAG: hypothetical protein N2246_01830 [Candidatus Sumerlaeia bacterium]|nr:hypothetical protein [Candidatus Sumerlaeia bacterium]